MRGVRLWGSLAFPKPMTWLERLAVRILAYRWHIEIDVETEEVVDCERCEGGTVPMDCPDCYGIGKVRI